MIRAFIALPVPQVLANRLALLAQMLPLPRRVPEADLHVTLAFLGDQTEAVLEEVHFALETLRAPSLELVLQGVGAFGKARPHSVHAVVRPDPPLIALQQKVLTAARRAGCTVEARRFIPHVTLGRFSPASADLPRLEKALVQFSTFSAGPEAVPAFGLYESRLLPSGPHYTQLAEYPLTEPWR
ncbi:RNA 2',3'-cyclic phosphodiesterase [Plastorhodobacter daqingensis]|uniref:RNA 2',3'-cyclic phosphodiesterase n=1 Tax=Plastorhodobacter daqingensis TaxID=1387281 RepID=A0ABW2UNV8_9RHOB